MTAINFVREVDRIHLVTDGRGRAPGTRTTFGPGGVRRENSVAMAMQKVAIFPHLNMAVALRGQAAHLPLIAASIPLFGRSFDEVRKRVADEFRPVFESATNTWVGHGVDERVGAVDIIFAGISEKSGPAAFIIPTHAFYADLKPWVAVDLVDEFFFSPPDPALYEKFDADSAVDVDAFAIGSIEFQRGIMLRGPDGVEFPGKLEIGEFAQVTTIARDHVTSRIVHRWRD